MNKVKLHIPIHTTEQIVIRDEIAKFLMNEYEAVVLHFTEILTDVAGQVKLLPVSVVSVYTDEITNNDIKFFKELAFVISEKVGEPVLLEITKEIIYVGTANMREI